MNKIKSLLFGSCRPDGNCAQLTYTAFRIFVGATMAIQHGLGKIKAPDGFIDNAVGALGLPMPQVMGWLAILAEFVGGICIALGLATRPAAFFLGCTMAVAGFIMHADDAFKVKELAFLYLACCVVIVGMGSGRFGIDSKIKK